MPSTFSMWPQKAAQNTCAMAFLPDQTEGDHLTVPGFPQPSGIPWSPRPFKDNGAITATPANSLHPSGSSCLVPQSVTNWLNSCCLKHPHCWSPLPEPCLQAQRPGEILAVKIRTRKGPRSSAHSLQSRRLFQPPARAVAGCQLHSWPICEIAAPWQQPNRHFTLPTQEVSPGHKTAQAEIRPQKFEAKVSTIPLRWVQHHSGCLQ